MFKIIDRNGIIYSGSELDMRILFRKIDRGEKQIDRKEYIEDTNDLFLVRVEDMQNQPESIFKPNYITIKVTFFDTIKEISSALFISRNKEDAHNLKEWIDSYESTRFTAISDNCCIITSEYNIEYVLEWLKENTVMELIENLD